MDSPERIIKPSFSENNFLIPKKTENEDQNEKEKEIDSLKKNIIPSTTTSTDTSIKASLNAPEKVKETAKKAEKSLEGKEVFQESKDEEDDVDFEFSDNTSHVPLELDLYDWSDCLQTSEPNKKSAVYEIPSHSPFRDTDLVVVKDEYNGYMPLYAIKKKDFDKIEQLYDSICNGKSPIQFHEPTEFMFNCLTNDIKMLLTRPTGRKLIEKLCASNRQILVIPSITNECIPNRLEVHYNPLADEYYTYRRSTRMIFPEFKEVATLPFTVLAHELIHALRCIYGTVSHKEPTTISSSYDNLEEQIAITGLKQPILVRETEKIKELENLTEEQWTKQDWTQDIGTNVDYDDVNENQLRIEFAKAGEKEPRWTPRMDHGGREELGTSRLLSADFDTSHKLYKSADFDTKYRLFESALNDFFYRTAKVDPREGIVVKEIIQLLFLHLLKEKASNTLQDSNTFKLLFSDIPSFKNSESEILEIARSILNIIYNKNDFYNDKGLLQYLSNEAMLLDIYRRLNQNQMKRKELVQYLKNEIEEHS